MKSHMISLVVLKEAPEFLTLPEIRSLRRGSATAL